MNARLRRRLERTADLIAEAGLRREAERVRASLDLPLPELHPVLRETTHEIVAKQVGWLSSPQEARRKPVEKSRAGIATATSARRVSRFMRRAA